MLLGWQREWKCFSWGHDADFGSFFNFEITVGNYFHSPHKFLVLEVAIRNRYFGIHI